MTNVRNLACASLVSRRSVCRAPAEAGVLSHRTPVASWSRLNLAPRVDSRRPLLKRIPSADQANEAQAKIKRTARLSANPAPRRAYARRVPSRCRTEPLLSPERQRGGLETTTPRAKAEVCPDDVPREGRCHRGLTEVLATARKRFQIQAFLPGLFVRASSSRRPGRGLAT